MIKKATSKDLMDILENTQSSVSEIKNNIDTIQKEIENRLTVIKNIQEYNNTELYSIEESFNKMSNDNNTIVLKRIDLYGTYDVYGNAIHPSFLKTPIDIFNLNSITGKIFKNNMNVTINNITKLEYTNMLKHDSIADKRIVFNEYESPDISIEIEINPNDLLGSTKFNTIEILPYISGSFDINSIEIYTIQDHYINSESPSIVIANTIQSVGSSRFLLEDTIDLWKIKFNIHINYINASNLYPFGFKHIYFLNGNYNPNSNIIFKVTKDKYIDWISEDIIVHSQNGRYESTCTDENIKLYMNYTSGVLSYEISTSKGLTQNLLNRNVKEFWVSLPIDKSIYSITFKEISKR